MLFTAYLFILFIYNFLHVCSFEKNAMQQTVKPRYNDLFKNIFVSDTLFRNKAGTSSVHKIQQVYRMDFSLSRFCVNTLCTMQ